MRNILLTFILSAFAAGLSAQETLTSDTLRNKFEAEAKSEREAFAKMAEEARKEYERYEQQMRKEYLDYVKSVKKVWGNDTIIDDTKSEWVEYSDDYQSRSIVNFETGDILIEVAFDDIQRYDSAEIDRRIAQTIEKMLDSRGTTCPYSSKVDINQFLTQRPILEGLVDLSKYTFPDSAEVAQAQPRSLRPAPPTPKVRGKELEMAQAQSTQTSSSDTTMAARVMQQSGNDNARRRQEAIERARELYSARAIATVAARQSPKRSVTIKGSDNKSRTVVQVKMSMVTDNISKNAALYKDHVATYSQKFQIEQPLIYAVMEQESYFNPEATSHVPAYGLMQLVPRSGGYDAYRYVYKRDWVPTKSYLYVPHQNIELGTAYLRILMNQFSGVTDPDCRRLCVIASYNTGAGNVSRAFTGNTNLGSAIPLINRYNYTQLYNHLTSRLSTEEARNYVSGVSKRREKYLKE
ncbi:MAG: DUF3393 domain-containing protein [Bacteroidaceae bacterium]|nr:DUF3393 domain-containing protein [Bacteroidaceae bacterium]